MLFCRAEETSIAGIGECLDQFCSLSGLRANPDKSSMFLSGVPAGQKAHLLSILGYSEGELPVRYLGVPLISSKLRGSYCQVLVDRITDKARSWKCRALSYAGRLQLIKSVLFSIQVYWSSMFILPKVVIRKVEAILRAFLWKGSDLSPGGCKVAWESLCVPKEEGGLGIKDMGVWNKAAMVKHLWFLCTDYESLWPCWVRSTILRGKNIWEVRCPGDCSWSWRKILGLRRHVRSHMRVCIGDGRQTSLWFDYWHPVGPLVQIYGDRLIYDTGVGRAARVADLVEGQEWVWPPVSSPAWLEILRATPSSFRPNSGRVDAWHWVGASSGPFSIRRAWETLRRRQPVVDWWKVVWHAKAIPRHSFILWLAIRNALYTQAKLFRYGMISVVQCVFYGGGREDLDHLFFGCIFSERIWRSLCANFGVPWTSMVWVISVRLCSSSAGAPYGRGWLGLCLLPPCMLSGGSRMLGSVVSHPAQRVLFFGILSSLSLLRFIYLGVLSHLLRIAGFNALGIFLRTFSFDV